MEVKAALADWANVTKEDRPEYAQTGTECLQVFATLDTGGGCETEPQCCEEFGGIQTSCSEADAWVWVTDPGQCSSAPGAGEACFHMSDHGKGWSDLTRTDGLVVVSEGHSEVGCEWETDLLEPDAYCSFDNDPVFHPDVLGREDCYYTGVTTSVSVGYGINVPVPNGDARATDSEDCDYF